MAARGDDDAKGRRSSKRISFDLVPGDEAKGEGHAPPDPTDSTDPQEIHQLYLPPLPPVESGERPHSYPGADQGRPKRKVTVERRASSDLESWAAAEVGEDRHAGRATDEEKGLFDDYGRCVTKQ